MSKTEETNLIENSVLDRRYFIKTSTAALAVVATGAIVSPPTETTSSAITEKAQNTTIKSDSTHWKAGWIAM